MTWVRSRKQIAGAYWSWAMKSFASSADLIDKEQTLEAVGDGVYALTADGDPNVGAIEGEDFVAVA